MCHSLDMANMTQARIRTEYYCHQMPSIAIHLTDTRFAVVRVYLSGDAPDQPLKPWVEGLKSVSGGICVIIDHIYDQLERRSRTYCRRVRRDSNVWVEVEATVRAFIASL